jgi:hypothetical protein
MNPLCQQKKKKNNSIIIAHFVCSVCEVKKTKKNVLFLFFFVFKAVNGYLIDNNNNQRKKNESFDCIKNQIMVYKNLATLHLHYDLEKPGYQGNSN